MDEGEPASTGSDKTREETTVITSNATGTMNPDADQEALTQSSTGKGRASEVTEPLGDAATRKTSHDVAMITDQVGNHPPEQLVSTSSHDKVGETNSDGEILLLSANPQTPYSGLEAPPPNPHQPEPTAEPEEAFTANMDHAEVDQSRAILDATAQAQLFMAAAAPPSIVPGVTTQIEPAIQPDTDSSDEAYAESTSTSYVTSIKSEISRGVLENERLYPSYGQHQYGMPVDDDELDRMDLQHRKYELVIGDKHFLAPIGPTPQRILDLATGTGIWALDVADMYPSAQVIGVDIAPIQPKWVASNCQFEIDDIEETWTFKENSFDFIHLRDPLMVVRNWPKLMEQCYSHVKPGGWCELACIYASPMCDDGTMPPESGFKLICDKLIEASYLFGAPVDCPPHFAEYLRKAGFVDVAEHIFKVPSSPWPKDRRLKHIGALEMTNVMEGATAFGLRAFEKVFGYTKEQTELAMVNFRRDVKNRHYHQYCQYFVVYGRKPPEPSSADYGIS